MEHTELEPSGVCAEKRRRRRSKKAGGLQFAGCGGAGNSGDPDRYYRRLRAGAGVAPPHEEAVRSAESANQIRSKFLSRISHDIRTLVNIINCMTAFAPEDIDNREKLKENLHQIQVSNTFLLSLISDILDIPWIDGGQIELRPEPYPCEESIADIRRLFGAMCCPPVSWRTEEASAARSRRTASESTRFLTNAVKYTPEGGTLFCITSIKSPPSGVLDCMIEIRDTGAGMSPEFQKRMFEPFTQEFPDETRSLRECGTGLGFSIVKLIVELMGGTLSVESARKRPPGAPPSRWTSGCPS